jgi:GNAT superfamily N-acetyltransferase
MQLPKGVRLAGPDDVERLCDFCWVSHADNGLFPLAPAKVVELLKRACCRPADHPPAVIALIDGPDRIEAAACLDAMTHWYSNDWLYVDRFLYVHPAHRRSRHAFRLLQFCRFWYEANGVPVVLSIETMKEREGKERLYSRYARRVGASFVIGELCVENATHGQGIKRQ